MSYVYQQLNLNTIIPNPPNASALLCSKLWNSMNHCPNSSRNPCATQWTWVIQPTFLTLFKVHTSLFSVDLVVKLLNGFYNYCQEININMIMVLTDIALGLKKFVKEKSKYVPKRGHYFFYRISHTKI